MLHFISCQTNISVIYGTVTNNKEIEMLFWVRVISRYNISIQIALSTNLNISLSLLGIVLFNSYIKCLSKDRASFRRQFSVLRNADMYILRHFQPC